MCDSASPATLLQAAAFAAGKHQNQRRKDAEASPYINHPLAVASVLAVEAGVCDGALLVAALLHDTVEDTETTHQELCELFGEAVARLVREVTDDKSLPKHVRKELQVEHAAAASDEAKQLKVADKICNMRDIVGNPPTDWSRQRKVDYLDWADRVVANCRGGNERLDAVYDQVLSGARKALGIED
jgi:guanosine-3',5'-bis(diphosphate) 3'-pyrophosphohydrolase